MKLRYRGKLYLKDRDLTASVIKALKNIRDAYELLCSDIFYLETLKIEGS